MKSAKDLADGEAKKEKFKADEAMQEINVLQNSLEMSKLTEEEAKKALNAAMVAEKESKKAKLDLESRVDTLEAKVKMEEDLLAREQEEKKQKIEDAEDMATLIWHGIGFGQQIQRSWTSLSWKKNLNLCWPSGMPTSRRTNS